MATSKAASAGDSEAKYRSDSPAALKDHCKLRLRDQNPNRANPGTRYGPEPSEEPTSAAFKGGTDRQVSVTVPSTTRNERGRLR